MPLTAFIQDPRGESEILARRLWAEPGRQAAERGVLVVQEARQARASGFLFAFADDGDLDGERTKNGVPGAEGWLDWDAARGFAR